MARITVEDCLKNVANRFELVMVAAKRARELGLQGKQPTLPWENDKPTVLALREIAAGHINTSVSDGIVLEDSLSGDDYEDHSEDHNEDNVGNQAAVHQAASEADDMDADEDDNIGNV